MKRFCIGLAMLVLAGCVDDPKTVMGPVRLVTIEREIPAEVFECRDAPDRSNLATVGELRAWIKSLWFAHADCAARLENAEKIVNGEN